MLPVHGFLPAALVATEIFAFKIHAKSGSARGTFQHISPFVRVTAKGLLFIGFMNYKDSLLITYSRVVICRFGQVKKMFLGNL